MTGLVASAFAACSAAAALFAGVALGDLTRTTEPAAPMFAPVAAVRMSQIAGVPVNALPDVGQCRVWYDTLPAEAQAPAMECEHAEWLAQKWGGRVINHEMQLAAHAGVNDFTGVPVEALPELGYCRAWIDAAPLAAQPAQSDCRMARRIAQERGGRVLFMPI